MNKITKFSGIKYWGKILESYGILNVDEVVFNPSYDEIKEHEKTENVRFTNQGNAAIFDQIPGKLPYDKYIVNNDISNHHIDWNRNNQMIEFDTYEHLKQLTLSNLNNKKKLYIMEVIIGPENRNKNRLYIRFILEFSWQAHYIKNMFTLTNEENFQPNFFLLSAISVKNESFQQQNLNSENFIILNIKEQCCIIGGNSYCGEMRKMIFYYLNYLFPLEGKMPLFGSANKNRDNITTLYIGPSYGSGRDTLSSDPISMYIAEEEIVWDDEGIYNIESGCFPLITSQTDLCDYNITSNTLFENVSIDEKTHEPVFDFHIKGRISFPICNIFNHEPTLSGNHPSNLLLITCDCYGILPPISKLDKLTAIYYYLSGFSTSVESQVGIFPIFTPCYNHFLPLHPIIYAKLLYDKINKYNVDTYLINTGFIGGSYSIGHRIHKNDCFTIINAIKNNDITNYEFDESLNLLIPHEVSGVNSNILNPRNSWEDIDQYNSTKQHLIEMFINNFDKFIDSDFINELKKYGPKL